MTARKTAQVHRFHDSVALFVGDGSTCYLTMKQARELAIALLNCSNDVSDRKFTDSQLGTVTIPIGCDLNDEVIRPRAGR
jgi:hypothetical protein